ncbi:MAG: adenylate/guanylate cyclase domain-containing protein [Magnetococcales bacterium]|nr:adenylate/guanylate cyclase domain-containing protein [Magnetococcales bacterium]
MATTPTAIGSWPPNPLGERPMQEGDWMVAIRQKLDEGQGFLAYDMVRAAMQHHPESVHVLLLGTLALLRSGAVEEARKLFAPLAERVKVREPQARLLLQILRRRGAALLNGDAEVEPTLDELELLRMIADGLAAMETGKRASGGHNDLETLKLLGEIHFEWWLHGFHEEDLRSGQEAFLECFRRENHLDTGINAAFLTWLMGKEKEAREIAQRVVTICQQERDFATASRHFRAKTVEAEALLLLGNGTAALEAYQSSMTLETIHYSWVAKCRARVALMQAKGIPVPPEVETILSPPVVVIFAGQELDRAGTTDPFFPPHLEDVVKEAIRERLEQLNAHIGYCSAASGSDLLFIEAMIERDAEVHIFLPCAVEDFLATRVCYAGPRWERRFHIALKLATTVNFTTEERLLGHQVLFRFNNQIIDGMARLRAQLLNTDPHLLLVWDYAAQSLAGTAADFMDQWPDIARLRLIDLDEMRANHPPAESFLTGQERPAVVAACQEPERVIKSMLFADIVGFSKLGEEDLPGLWRFLAALNNVLEAQCQTPDLVESWGDALYVVQSSASDLLHYAFTLQQGFSNSNPGNFGLSKPLQLRIGLHAGPVFAGVHPLTGRNMIYGSHVSRTARIEPVTVPGQIYCSQQFVALLTMEESTRQHRLLSMGELYTQWYDCTYLGIQHLAKNYGSQPVYHLRAKIPC